MEYKIIVAGIGPGSPDYLLPAAKKAIEAAGVLVGSNRALADYAKSDVETMAITGNIEATLNFIEAKRVDGDVTVMVSGDPGYYSLLDALRRKFPAHVLEVIPGVSSMQLAFARLSLSWQEARLVSLHGRSVDRAMLGYRSGQILAILTDTVHTSHKIGVLLAEVDWPLMTKVFLCTRLSYEDETIIETTVAGLDKQVEFSHCIMVVME